MAVQAQYPSSNAFCIRSNPLEEIQQLQNMNGTPFGGYQNYGIAGQHILNGTVFSEPESDLTCNASGSRKRTRENQMVATLKTHQLHYQHQLLPTPSPPNLPAAPTATAATSASPLHMFPELPNNRLHDDGAGTSASGTSSLSSIPQQLYSYLCTHNLDLDTFIRHQNQKLRLIVEETRKKHCRSLLSIIEQQSLKRLEEKEIELENVSRVNVHLQEKVKQISEENQMWFNAAKNSEARVSSLRSSLEQMLVQNAGQQAIEGFGETEGVAEDAESCCNTETEEAETRVRRVNAELKQRKTCKCCGGADISVLLLPCRHLCVCKDCEMRVESCPICNSVKNATLRVFMS